MFRGKLKIVASLILCMLVFLVLRTVTTSADSSQQIKKNINFEKIVPIVKKECEAHKNVPPEVILALIGNESGFNPLSYAKGSSGSHNIGLMQINDKTAKKLWKKVYPNMPYDVKKLFIPEINIKLGVSHFAALLAQYHNNVEMTLTGYNRGDGGLKKYVASRGTYVSTYSRELIVLSQKYKTIVSKTK